MRIALYQPDIAQNTGTILRLCACLGMEAHIFERWRPEAGARLILFTTRAERSYLEHACAAGDVLMFGRETAGVAPEVHAAAEARLRIPMRPGLRSLNVAMACAMAAGEALRQTGAVASDDARP